MSWHTGGNFAGAGVLVQGLAMTAFTAAPTMAAKNNEIRNKAMNTMWGQWSYWSEESG
ncbi:hypothetical protein KJ765_00050 [Candidatus Micrarchaeota archaeon]|nr:hypothetical protein [Candidatus Micrarchaeota archaeon]